MAIPADEAGAAIALVSRLAIEMASRGDKEAILGALTDCMEGLLMMGRQGAAELLHKLHDRIQADAPEDGDAPPAS
jgi:hypothetical protein